MHGIFKSSIIWAYLSAKFYDFAIFVGKIKKISFSSTRSVGTNVRYRITISLIAVFNSVVKE